MQYLKVTWKHDVPTEPTLIFSEIDSEGWEQRKIEVFHDGAVTFAHSEEQTGTTQLSEVPLPPIEEINADSQFAAEWITKLEFDAEWDQRRRQS